MCGSFCCQVPPNPDYSPAAALIDNVLALAVLVFRVLITLATASRAVRYLLISTVETLAGPPEHSYR